MFIVWRSDAIDVETGGIVDFQQMQIPIDGEHKESSETG